MVTGPIQHLLTTGATLSVGFHQKDLCHGIISFYTYSTISGRFLFRPCVNVL